MASLGRRLQILLDEDRYQRIAQRAAEERRPVAAVVRQAIDLAFPTHAEVRRRAGQSFLQRQPMPVGDWDDVKAEILDAAERGL